MGSLSIHLVEFQELCDLSIKKTLAENNTTIMRNEKRWTVAEKELNNFKSNCVTVSNLLSFKTKVCSNISNDSRTLVLSGLLSETEI